jgi:UDP-N-acetyl-D-glucosamine dehydrogenase
MEKFNNLKSRYNNKNITIGIVGLGYVGLPLMWTFHESGVSVLGFDIDETKISCIQKGIPYIKHLGKEMMSSLSNSTKADATSDFSKIKDLDVIILCVPTPLNHHREPDMSYVIETTSSIAKYLKKNQLVILESTTWPGTTEELMIPILEKESNLKASVDFFVAYSPEREDPGNPNFNTSKIPKVVGGHCKKALELSITLYNMAINKVIPVNNCKTAEATKLTENIFRAVNIAMVNELKILYQKMNIDVHEVLEAADSKPFGFMKFTPGPGLGGHCIPIDPFYLTWKAKEFDMSTKFIELAGEINNNMPQYVVDRTIQALNILKNQLMGVRYYYWA